MKVAKGLVDLYERKTWGLGHVEERVQLARDDEGGTWARVGKLTQFGYRWRLQLSPWARIEYEGPWPPETFKLSKRRARLPKKEDA